MFYIWIIVNIESNSEICKGKEKCTYGQNSGQETSNCRLAQTSTEIKM